MTKEAARRVAKMLARGMGITFYVVRSRYGRFLAVQVPSDGCQILETIRPPTKSANGSAGSVIEPQTVLPFRRGAAQGHSPRTRGNVRAQCSLRKSSPASTF